MTETNYTLEEISQYFGETYTLSKEWDTLKTNAQKQLFQAFTNELEKRRLPQKTIDLSEIPEEERKAWVTTHHPGWRTVSNWKDHPEKAVIERDPSLMKFTTKPIDGYVYGRTITEGTPSLDEERLQVEDLDLWLAITAWPEPWYSILRDCFPDEPAMADEVMMIHDIKRVIKDPDTWTPEQAAAVQQYMVPGPITVKLVPPRQANPEELESESTE